ncbi:MAG: hypothetical protein HY076_02810 [Candidatus Eisenbacteria bacterium]|uniref:Cell wall-active antibiotics response LiaF-like C-terminal domain-containing protein n=1 Tax=Eiseniibacteriota bacterium TaxID=2212470 RepID=A0A9D6QNR0_UNCEI|nr:hypothetical protein [Candidatus Eisenbacteria bacterium]
MDNAELRDRIRRRGIYGVRWTGSSVNGRLIFGLIILTLGLLWTLDNLGLIDSERVIAWWPAVLARRNVVWGATFSIAGLWLLAGSLDLIHAHLFSLWPLMLIAIGVTILTRSSAPRTDVSDASAEKLNTLAFWSHTVRKVISNRFSGGEVSALMGGTEIDLRGAESVEGGAVIDLFVWWGGVNVIVSDQWRVVNEATAIMGGIEDSTRPPAPDARHTLILRGVIIMGGVEIKH